MNLVLHRIWLCLFGAVSGLILGASAWFLFFGFYILLLNSINPTGITVLHEIGPQLCSLIGALSGGFIGGVSAFFRLRKQTAIIAAVVFNFAIATLIISDDALIIAQVDMRTLIIGSSVFHVVSGLISGWLISTLYTFIGEILDDTYRGKLFGLNKEKEDEIISLNIAHTVPRRRIAPNTEPIAEPVMQPDFMTDAALFVKSEAVPELPFEPGRDWDIFTNPESEMSSVSFSYTLSDKPLDMGLIGEMIATLLPFETASATEKITSQQNFRLYKQKALANPRITYRTGTLKPDTASQVRTKSERKIKG